MTVTMERWELEVACNALKYEATELMRTYVALRAKGITDARFYDDARRRLQLEIKLRSFLEDDNEKTIRDRLDAAHGD